MKIGYVLDDTLDSTDGVQQYVLLVGEWMRHRGHDVHYLVGQSKRSDVSNVHSLSRNLRVRFNKNRLSVPISVKVGQIDQLLESEKFDVIHVQMPFSPFLSGKLINRLPSQTAVVGTFHVAPHSRTVSLAAKSLSKLQRKALHRVDSVISVSTVAQQFARRAFGLSSVVVPNAIATRDWKPKKKSPATNHRQIVFLGRLVERKGCIYFLKALRELYDEGLLTTVNVVIAGDGPDRSRLEKFAKENSLGGRVSFRGFIAEADKKLLLQESYAAVFPSTGGESFGIVLLEAMAAGTVAIAGDNPGYRTVLGEVEGAFVNPKDTNQFAGVLRHLLVDADYRQDLLKQQAQLVKAYDINSVGNDILGIYAQALKAKHRS